MRKSRLSTYTEKKTKKTIFLSIIGIVIILFLVLRFGLDLLVNFSLFLSGPRSQVESQSNSNSINYLAAPVLNPTFTATNSAEVNITGKAMPDSDITLYLNGSTQDQTKAGSDGIFSFNEILKNGDNQIKAKAQNGNKKSDYSDPLNILYTNSAPTLDISTPFDGQTFNNNQTVSDNTINITGQTDSGATVTINNFIATVDENNNFSYSFAMQNGDNQIKIIAVDQAGNKTEKDLKITYSP
jgi:uncharacterized protein YfaP (DUF2135 family)